MHVVALRLERNKTRFNAFLLNSYLSHSPPGASAQRSFVRVAPILGKTPKMQRLSLTSLHLQSSLNALPSVHSESPCSGVKSFAFAEKQAKADEFLVKIEGHVACTEG